MSGKNGDMYDYILESGEAVRNIVKEQERVFADAREYLRDKTIEQIYLLGSGTSYHGSAETRQRAGLCSDCSYGF